MLTWPAARGFAMTNMHVSTNGSPERGLAAILQNAGFGVTPHKELYQI